MKVKICGVCRPDDALAAAAAGADYIGVILAPGGPRTQTGSAAAAIFAQLFAQRRVGVFADQDIGEVCALAGELGLDVIQLHGREDASFVAAVADSTGCAVWKTVWPGSPADLEAAVAAYGAYVNGLLLDAASGGKYGGTGARFDWTSVAHARSVIPADMDLILAGGLTADNVKQAITLVGPDVVDVSSGVEQATCRKSPAALRAFVRNART